MRRTLSEAVKCARILLDQLVTVPVTPVSTTIIGAVRVPPVAASTRSVTERMNSTSCSSNMCDSIDQIKLL